MNYKNFYLHKINLIKEKLKESRYLPILLVVLIIVVVSTVALVHGNNQKSKDLQSGIAEELIRFHVIANSDSKEDQELKILIKDSLIEELDPYLTDINSVSEARDILYNNLTLMESLANEKIKENGFTYTVRASLEYDYFPLKVYGDIALPPGTYEAVRIELGDASGRNWWCVMFPPLCFVDSTYSVVSDSSKEQLSDVLTEEEYDKILIEDNEEIQVEGKVKVKFKVFTILNDVFDLE